MFQSLPSTSVAAPVPRTTQSALLVILIGGTPRAGCSFQLSQRTGFQHGVRRDYRNGDLPFRL